MKADFSGYATKAGLKCTDGRTIMAHAFQKQDKTRVPLVWQHGHSEVKNVLGHAILENREDGVYAYGFFNDSAEAKHAAGLVEHEDINMMSIWANQLIERSGTVIHGVIREVSLVLSGANPGALIESVTIQHDDGSNTEIDDEAIITTGLTLEHTAWKELEEDDADVDTDVDVDLEHAGDKEDDEDGETVQDVYNSMSEKQKDVVHFMIGEVLDGEVKDEVKQSNTDEDDTVTEDEDEDSIANHGNTDKEGSNMTNVFDQTDKADAKNTLSHDALNEIVKMATKSGSLQSAMDDYALSHGIENIEVMFPDAQAVSAQPDWVSRRTEWVASFIGGTRKSPFSKIKSLSADITEADARAKGYITGTLKREEFFSVAKRVTEPTTVYKKQKLERDDVIDITEYNVVAWLKAEMRIMLDEEIARAALVGDGRDISSDDKINEQNIRPIATDNELYTTVVNVNILDASSSAEEVIDALIMNRSKYKGTGQPNFYTTETQIAQFLLVKDTQGRRIYGNLMEVAQVIRVKSIIPVEVMEEYPDIVGVMVNPGDYTMGANKGGEVNMFDDFDIDYNQMKYLIETRLCGALTKPKSALVVKSVAVGAALVTPLAPTFDATDGELIINDTVGVVYTNSAEATVTNAGGPYTVASGESETITATPASAAYYFATSDSDDWTFTSDAY